MKRFLILSRLIAIEPVSARDHVVFSAYGRFSLENSISRYYVIFGRPLF